MVEKTIYEKIIEARSFFQSSPKHKSGFNPHLKSNFFQLDDIVPIVSKIEITFKLFFHITFEDKGVLTIFNVEKPDEKLIYTTPFSINNIKGMSDIQAIGAVETYSRRYLYTMALDVIETDGLDQTLGEPEKVSQFLNETEAKNILHTLAGLGMTKEIVNATMKQLGLNKMSELKRSMIDTFIKACKDTQLAPENFKEDVKF